VDLPFVSIIVIGRNEERNLPASFAAIDGMDYPREKLEIIYVDSDSDDASREIASRWTNRVLTERHSLPSAARGRNKGLVAARGGIVHFVDGDTAIDPGYLKRAVTVLENPEIHAVSGSLMELGQSFWAWLMSSAWDGPRDGPAASTSAGGTYRRKSLMNVNGYDERLVMGEETELGDRFRNHGFKIWSIDHPMGIHRYALNGLADYLKRCVKNGRIQARSLFIPSESDYFRRSRRLVHINVLFHFLFILALGMTFLARQPIFIVYSFCVYLIFLFAKYLIIRRIKSGRLFLHFVVMNLARPFSFWGQCTEYLKLAFNRRYRELVSVEKMRL